MGCSPSNPTVSYDREKFEQLRSNVIRTKNPAPISTNYKFLPPIGHVSRESHKEEQSRARKKSKERKPTKKPPDNADLVTFTAYAKADEVNTSKGHFIKGKPSDQTELFSKQETKYGKTSDQTELFSKQETKDGSTFTARREHLPPQKTEAPGTAWLEDSSGLENWKTSDQTKLFSKQETKDGSTFTARREHLPPQKTEAPGTAWLEDSSGLENRKTSDQTELFSKQETKDGQPLDRTHGDHKKKTKKEKKKKPYYEETREAKDHNAAERNENHYASSSYDMNTFHENQRNTNRLETLVSQLREEKAGLLNRLSEIGAIRLTENNPNVTDLGDANRPEKVVEQLSELYDNEWTDAYEYLTKTRNESIERSVKRLLQVLQETFKFCILSTEKKKETLRNAITNYVGLTKQEQDEIEFKDIEKKLREYRMKKLQNNFKRTEQEVGDQLKRLFTTETFENVSEYIGSCIRICWKMCIKEPPMYLDFGDSKEPAQSSNETATKMHFDKAKFMCYTKSGNYIDYVVWPAVYLCKNGPLMRKGVAQGTEEDEEYEDDTDTPI